MLVETERDRRGSERSMTAVGGNRDMSGVRGGGQRDIVGGDERGGFEWRRGGSWRVIWAPSVRKTLPGQSERVLNFDLSSLSRASTVRTRNAHLGGPRPPPPGRESLLDLRGADRIGRGYGRRLGAGPIQHRDFSGFLNAKTEGMQKKKTNISMAASPSPAFFPLSSLVLYALGRIFGRTKQGRGVGAERC